MLQELCVYLRVIQSVSEETSPDAVESGSHGESWEPWVSRSWLLPWETRCSTSSLWVSLQAPWHTTVRKARIPAVISLGTAHCSQLLRSVLSTARAGGDAQGTQGLSTDEGLPPPHLWCSILSGFILFSLSLQFCLWDSWVITMTSRGLWI